MDNTKHTANFLASRFLISKRSLKKIYRLNPGCIAILRYICDSIDLNFKKRKQFKTKLPQSQIAKHCHCSLRSVSRHISLLMKKRFILFDEKTLTYSLGKVLHTYAKMTYPIDLRQFGVDLRSTPNLPISKSSNLTNNSEFKGARKTASKASELLETFMKRQKS